MIPVFVISHHSLPEGELQEFLQELPFWLIQQLEDEHGRPVTEDKVKILAERVSDMIQIGETKVHIRIQVILPHTDHNFASADMRRWNLTGNLETYFEKEYLGLLELFVVPVAVGELNSPVKIEARKL